MCECKICNKEQKSLMNLSKHLSNKHKYSPREYYDLYLKKDNENICVICGNETKYIQFTKGYNNTCSHKCGAILYRKELRADAEKFANFKNKVKKNQIRIWEEREETINKDGISEKEIISNKVGATISSNNLLLTKDELNNKYGWLNKLSTTEKEKWKTEIMFKTGCHAFWKNASDEEKKSVQLKRNAAKLRVTEEIIQNLEENLEDKELYYESVKYLTNITYNRYKNIIDPANLRGHGYHLDHRHSVIFGFINKVPPEIISSIHNLEIIPENENLKKNSKCSISAAELLEKFYD